MSRACEELRTIGREWADVAALLLNGIRQHLPRTTAPTRAPREAVV